MSSRVSNVTMHHLFPQTFAAKGSKRLLNRTTLDRLYGFGASTHWLFDRRSHTWVRLLSHRRSFVAVGMQLIIQGKQAFFTLELWDLQGDSPKYLSTEVCELKESEGYWFFNGYESGECLDARQEAFQQDVYVTLLAQRETFLQGLGDQNVKKWAEYFLNMIQGIFQRLKDLFE